MHFGGAAIRSREARAYSAQLAAFQTSLSHPHSGCHFKRGSAGVPVIWHAYNSAFRMAQLAEKAYHFERPDDSTVYVGGANCGFYTLWSAVQRDGFPAGPENDIKQTPYHPRLSLNIGEDILIWILRTRSVNSLLV